VCYVGLNTIGCIEEIIVGQMKLFMRNEKEYEVGSWVERELEKFCGEAIGL